MPIVSSFGSFKSLHDPQPTWVQSGSGSLNLYGLSRSYYQIYESQPNVRICVDFLARNIAELNRPIYRRVSDTDRVRLKQHDLARWLDRPNPATTRYRLIEDLMTDLGIYFRAYWLKIRYDEADGRPAIGLVRLPPDEVTVEGGLMPSAFVWTVNGQAKTFAPSEIVHFSGYRMGISPLETLRRILAEESAAGQYRESLWSHGAKHEGIWERDKDAPNHTTAQLNDWREQWQKFASTSKSGMTAVGEKGWKYVPTSFSSRDSEYVQGGKLRREICAAQYHIPQPLVGILDHATFSNIKEQHKHLYQDTLGPWNEMIDQEIERQLLIECDDQDNIYIEANITAKLAGSFEEQSNSLHLLVGKPIMTANEGRARLNLPRDPDPKSDELAPQQGGPAASETPDDEDAPPPADAKAPTVDTTVAAAPVLQATRDRQRARLARLPVSERPAAFLADLDRWNRELSADLSAVLGHDATAQAEAANGAMLAQLTAEATATTVERLAALEQRPPRPWAMRRTYTRNPDNGLVTEHVDTPTEGA